MAFAPKSDIKALEGDEEIMPSAKHPSSATKRTQNHTQNFKANCLSKSIFFFLVAIYGFYPF